MTTDRPAGTGASEGVSTSGLDFIRQIVVEDRQAGKNEGRVHTRFPPEPNGYLHIGHAKAICLAFGLADEHDGLCNLRMDDTNPTTESVEYVRAIEDDVRWLGFDWGDRFVHASDYFDQLYDFALQLIRAGHAYVCDLRGSEVSEYRGLGNEPGRNSPNRDRTVAENLELFDTTFSMGVLYHRRSPIDFLAQLKAQLRPGGELVLETLVIEGDENTVLVPTDRYAKMRNVWFIPSTAALKLWMERVGFKDVQIKDCAITTLDEQRRTDWMENESLVDFLDPNDTSKTIEGYPAPLRAILTAKA